MPERENDVVVSIDIAAPPHIVHSFFADPVRFSQWLGHDAVLSNAEGEFRIPYPDGNAAVGRVNASEPDRITMTWGYENSAHGVAPGSSTVEVRLRATSLGTTLELIHAGLPSDVERRNHAMGWKFYVGALANAASSVYLKHRVESVVDAYIFAWGATDQLERRRFLDECWADDGVFKDAMGYAGGRDEIDAYIGNAQRFMPGVVLRRTGPVTRSHGHLMFEWEIATADGTVVGRGRNVGELDSSARIREMVGFAS